MSTEFPIGGVCRLADRGVIRASGADAASFLQSQLTNDVASLGPGSARLAGFCSAKGRLQASFVVWRPAADEFLLSCPRDLLAPTLKRLTMFVLRAKCRLSDASDELAVFAIAGRAATAMLDGVAVWQVRGRGATTVVRLPDAAGVERAWLVAAAGAEADVPAAAAMSIETWRWLEVESGIVTVEAATVDRFVPQMVNFELVGGVDFQKGCYPGQEVVARSQYRGTTKRRTFLFDCDAVPLAGQDVFASGHANEPVGTVANAAPHPLHAGGSALVEVRLAAITDELRLGAADGALLTRRALPYSVPLDAAVAS